MTKLNFSTFFVKYFWHIVFVLVLTVAIISYWGFAKPKIDLLKVGGALNPDPYLNVIKRQEQYLANLQSLVDAYDKLSLNRLERLDLLVGNKTDYLDAVVLTSRIIKSQGLGISGFNVEPGEGSATISLTVTNKTYPDFKQFLRYLESSLRLIDLRSLNFSLNRNSYGLQLVIYYLE